MGVGSAKYWKNRSKSPSGSRAETTNCARTFTSGSPTRLRLPHSTMYALHVVPSVGLGV